MALTVSRLRENIYRVLDQVLETGVPVEVVRRGKRLRIVPVDPGRKLDNLTPHVQYLVCDPDEVVSVDWSAEWQP